ncbi:1-aminocyclopropane-1-carboxylate deaminase/D-cysteine desulfhydrase [Psychroflexus sp. S27]|uniref:1-aminocyclopropane-1-carboxylate deaminase/D-cysteine desulfhydrase n=1 Tax=Psychroflexus sp. S27 TaxID=1982757 RepID=UPI00293736F7|nr:pyridoxal-phosphate dependent enzyme [Psychroflexus sp. S27]
MANFFKNTPISENQRIDKLNNVEIYLKREDQIHPEVSGNKFRKLKYNLLDVHENQTVLTFGGAFSNHILATAKACEMLNLNCIGVIRGDELGVDLVKTLYQNKTLRTAHEAGMQLYFVSRQDYRLKEQMDLVQRLSNRSDLCIIPEGGTNEKAILGCQEILTEEDKQFEYIACALGTSGTFVGLLKSSESHQHLLGFPALKGDFFKNEIQKYTQRQNYTLEAQYHFGGYAKYNKDLIDFINRFKQKYHVQLDPIYTGKMIYGLYDMIEKNQFQKNTRILAIHTGGLQGIYGFNAKLRSKTNYEII